MSALRRTSSAGLAAVLLAGSVALTACGGPEKDTAPQSSAPCGLKATRKGHLTLDNVQEALSRPSGKRITQRYRQELTVGKRSAAIEGVVDASPDKLYALEQTMPGDDGTVKLIVVDDMIYVSAEGEKDGKFYEVDPTDSGDPLAAPMKAVLDGAGTGAAATWTAGLVGIRYVGKETVDDGTETEFYEFDVDTRLAARAAGEEVPDDAPRLTTSYVWVDKYDLIRKTSTTIGDEKTVETYTDFCAPVDIKAPAAKDIIAR